MKERQSLGWPPTAGWLVGSLVIKVVFMQNKAANFPEINITNTNLVSSILTYMIEKKSGYEARCPH